MERGGRFQGHLEGKGLWIKVREPPAHWQRKWGRERWPWWAEAVFPELSECSVNAPGVSDGLQLEPGDGLWDSRGCGQGPGVRSLGLQIWVGVGAGQRPIHDSWEEVRLLTGLSSEQPPPVCVGRSQRRFLAPQGLELGDVSLAQRRVLWGSWYTVRLSHPLQHLRLGVFHIPPLCVLPLGWISLEVLLQILGN